VDRFGDELAWTIVQNQNRKSRKMNAVAYGPEQERVRRFYLYLAD
jgi:hypothetical protein